MIASGRPPSCPVAGLHAWSVALGLAIMLCVGVASGQQVLHVALDGNDAWAGTADRPLASLEGARNAIRAIKSAGSLPEGGVEVIVHPGTYRVEDALEFGEEDSGTIEAPIIYRAARKGTVRLSGSLVLNGFTRVTEPDALARLDPTARENIWQANLKEPMPELGDPPMAMSRVIAFSKASKVASERGNTVLSLSR